MSVYRRAFRGGGRSEVDLAVYQLAFRGGGRSEVDLAMDRSVHVRRSSSTLGRSGVVTSVGATGFGRRQALFFLFYFTSDQRCAGVKACLPLVYNARRKFRDVSPVCSNASPLWLYVVVNIITTERVLHTLHRHYVPCTGSGCSVQRMNATARMVTKLAAKGEGGATFFISTAAVSPARAQPIPWWRCGCCDCDGTACRFIAFSMSCLARVFTCSLVCQLQVVWLLSNCRNI
jgi:hypothetical protein